MINNNSAIGTLAAKLKDDAMLENENVVKVFTEKEIVTAIENTGGCENPNDRPYKVKQ